MLIALCECKHSLETQALLRILQTRVKLIINCAIKMGQLQEAQKVQHVAVAFRGNNAIKQQGSHFDYVFLQESRI